MPSESRLPDTGFDAPESLTPADGGKDVVEIDTTGNVIIRNSATGVVERQVAGPIKGIATGDNSQYAAALDPEAKYAAVNVSQADNGYPTDNVDIIDMATGAITRLPGGAAIGVAYDGEQLLIQRASGTFEVRSADGRQLIRSFAGDGDATAGPVVNGAGLAVEVNPNGTAPVVDVASGQQIGLLTLPVGPRSVSTSVAFAANGQYLVSATEDADGDYGPGYVTTWNFSPSYWTAVACSTAGHTLTSAEWREYVGAAGPGLPSQLAC